MKVLIRRMMIAAGLLAGVALGVWLGPVDSLGRLAAALAVALLWAGVMALTGQRWAWAGAATILAVSGLSGDGMDFVLRHAAAPTVFLAMAGKLAVLAVVWIGGLAVIGRWSRRRAGWRTGQPARDFMHCLGPGIGSALIAAVVGGGVSYLLLRDPHPQQAVGGLIVAFAVAGLAARTAFAEGGDPGILASPALVGLAGYAWAWLNYADMPSVLADLYQRSLPPWVLALPVHYLGAGTLGAVIGVVWARSLAGTDAADTGRIEEKTVAAAAAEAAGATAGPAD